MNGPPPQKPYRRNSALSAVNLLATFGLVCLWVGLAKLIAIIFGDTFDKGLLIVLTAFLAVLFVNQPRKPS